MVRLWKRIFALALVLCMIFAVLPTTLAKSKDAEDLASALEQKPTTRRSDTFTVGSSGRYVIAANVDGVYYAMSNSFSSKILGSEITVTNGMVSEEQATDFALNFEYVNGKYTITNDTHYLTYASSTNLGASTSEYFWNISEGINGSWRITSDVTATRGVVFRAKTYLQFGGYAVSNASATSAEYFDVEILPVGTVSGSTEEVFTRVTSASDITSGRYVILVGASDAEASYSFYALWKQEDNQYYALNVAGTSLTSVPGSITASEGLVWTVEGSASSAKIGGGDGYYLYNDPSSTSKLEYSNVNSSAWKFTYNSAKGAFTIKANGYLALRDDSTEMGQNGLPVVTCYESTSVGSAYFYVYKSSVGATCSHSSQNTDLVEATCTEAGYEIVTCNNCGKTLSNTTLPATGHSYNYSSNGNGTHIVGCFNCSYSKQANCTFADNTCKYCGWVSGSATTGDFHLVTALNQITDGEYVLVVAPGGANPGAYSYYAITRQMHSTSYVMSEGLSMNSIPSTLSVSNELMVWTLSGSNEGFTLTGADGSALYNSSNNLYYGDGIASYWVPTLDNGAFTLNADGRYLGLRDDLATVDANGNPCFRCNSSAKTSSYRFYLFKSGELANPECFHENTSTALVPATCTESGSLKVTCNDCGEVVTDEIVEPLGHNASYVEGIPAGCTTTGNIPYYICTRCNKFFTDTLCQNEIKESATVVSPIGHEVYAVGGIEATCGTEGMMAHYVCYGCGGYFLDSTATQSVRLVDLTIPALGHDLTETPEAPATCASPGNLQYFTCEICYTMFSDESCSTVIVLNDVYLPALNHTPIYSPVVPATCTDSGVYAYYYCADCDLYYANSEYTETVTEEELIAPPLGHDIFFTAQIEPACTESGILAHYYCNRCSLLFADAAGKTVLDESDILIAATGHSYVNGVCSTCGQMSGNIDSAIVINHTLNLASDISISFMVKNTLLSAYDSYYMVCKVPVYEGNNLVEYETVQIQPGTNGNYYYFTLTGLTAMQMGDEIEAVLHMFKGNSSYRSNVDIYSISKYAYSQLNKDNASYSLKALCANLLQYGAAAQTYKSYRTDSYVDKAMTEVHKSYLTNPETVKFNNHNTYLDDLASPTVAWQGKSLVMDSKVVIRYVVNISGFQGDVSDLSLRITYLDYLGEKMEVTLKNIQKYGSNSSWYSFDFDGLLAAELRQVVSAAVYDGNKQVSKTLQYSVDTYGNGKTGNLLAVCKAMIAYSDAALAYFNS